MGWNISACLWEVDCSSLYCVSGLRKFVAKLVES